MLIHPLPIKNLQDLNRDIEKKAIKSRRSKVITLLLIQGRGDGNLVVDTKIVR